ncbi:hypothetical protein ACIQAL_22100 [Pseudomonas sp. NPDC088368]|uniref:hypothetical protein n=1 Tax=Pseudomonas sp. NPDC088368 TaxID=3364453 RepID=UPI0037F6EE0D
MKLPLRPSLSSPIILLALSVFGLAGWCGYQQFVILRLSQQISNAANQESITALAQRVGGIEDRYDKSADFKPVSIDDFRAGQQALSNRIDSLHDQLKPLQQTVQESSQAAASMLDVVALEAKFEGLQLTVQDLVRVRPEAPATPPIPRLKTPPLQKNEAVVKAVESTPPFTVVGVEYRGGERFLSVAPPGSTRLSQLYLVRPGDMIEGSNWRLSALDDSRAQFNINGSSRIIALKP